MNLRAHAKINLSLAVRGVRPDGYHELRTVFQSLALHDTLRFAPAEEGFVLTCSSPEVPVDERNLVWKAARMVWDAAGRRGEPRGRVRIKKRIPVQGGLGGGSADGAAALVGWNRLWHAGLSAAHLRELACGLGADVPFFLCAGTALGLNRGDDIRPLDDLPARWVVLVFPPFGVSTPAAFSWWDEDQVGPAAGAERPATPMAVFNDLEAPVSRRHPQLVELRRELERAGAEAAAMTGSGSTVFGLFTARAVARAASNRVGLAGWRSLVTRTATRVQARPG
jgi:4-diphosphocytidyl-2-C-methyl-D-erythritol kinase